MQKLGGGYGMISMPAAIYFCAAAVFVIYVALLIAIIT